MPSCLEHSQQLQDAHDHHDDSTDLEAKVGITMPCRNPTGAEAVGTV